MNAEESYCRYPLISSVDTTAILTGPYHSRKLCCAAEDVVEFVSKPLDNYLNMGSV